MKTTRIKILIFTFLVFSFFVFNQKSEAAVLRMSPSQTEVTVGNIVKIQFSLNTLGKTINNAESAVQFPTDLLEVVSIDRSSSIFSLWVENPSFSNTAGQITFNGGVPNPGFQGSNGNIISVVFRAKKTGTASVVFSNSAVRENDGLGTDILSSKIDSTINIITSQAVQPVQNFQFVVSSSSHANQNVWYNKKDIELSWTLPQNATSVRTGISTSKDSDPSTNESTPIKRKTLKDIDDGVWYFNVKYLADGVWSKTQSYKIQIDTTSPTNLSIESEKDNLGKTTLYMKADDATSGIDYFTIKTNEDQPITVKSNTNGEASAEIPFIRAGEHILTISAFDKAGNKTETITTITADQVQELKIDSYPATIRINESIEISGTAPYAYASLRISLKDSNDVIQVYKLKSNSYSQFNFISQPIVNEGSYTVWVDMLKDNEEIIITSQKINIAVETPLLLQIGSYTIGLMKVLIPAIILLIIFLIVLLYGWLRFFSLYRRVKKESKEAEQISSRTFGILREGVDRHIKQLKKAKRKLTDEEMEFLQEFSAELEEADKVISKEIHDISKK